MSKERLSNDNFKNEDGAIEEVRYFTEEERKIKERNEIKVEELPIFPNLSE